MSENTTEKTQEQTIKDKDYVRPMNARIYLTINGLLLKRFLTIFSHMSTELKLNFNSEGFNAQLVDPAHVCMIMQRMKKESCNEYSILSDEKTVSIGFDLDKILSVLKTVKKEDRVKIEYDTEKDFKKLFLTIGSFQRELGLIDTEGMPDTKIPHLYLPSKVIVESKTVYDFLKQSEKVSDHMSIETNTDTLTLYAEGDTDKLRVVLERWQLKFIGSEKPGAYKSLFSTDYMINVVSALKPLFTQLIISIGNDNPIQIMGENPHHTVLVLIAPRIESE